MTGLNVQSVPQAAGAGPAQRRIRVLMGIPARGATGGGPALHLPMLVDDLRRRGDVDVVTMAYGRWQEAEPIPLKIWHQFVDLLRYPRQIRESGPDIVHLNSALDRRALARDLPFAILTRLSGKLLFIKWHGGESELLSLRAQPWRLLVKTLLRTTDALGVLSTEEADAVRRHPNAPRCEVVRNSLDLGRYDRQTDLRVRHGLPSSTPLLLFIGRLLPTKGLVDVVRCMRGITTRHGAHLMVVGDGPERAVAQTLARQLSLERVVHFLGSQSEDEAADYYCGCDVLVFPTHHPEGFPMVVFQSVAAGLGVVTTRIRAMADYLRDPENCLFTPARDPEGLEAALDRLLGDKELLLKMQRNNRELARRFERHVVAAEFARLYGEIAKRTTSGNAGEDPRGFYGRDRLPATVKTHSRLGG